MTKAAHSDRLIRDLIGPCVQMALADARCVDEGDIEYEKFFTDLFRAGPWADWPSQHAAITAHLDALRQRLATRKTGGTPCRD